MKIVVVIPVFNRPNTVLRTIASVAGQSRKVEKCVVVDDGSTDDTISSIESWHRSHSAEFPLHIIKTTHGGAGAARNAGWRHVGDCDAVCFLDSDDVWPVDFVAGATSVLQDASVALAPSSFGPDERKLEQRQVAPMVTDPFKFVTGNLGDPGILSCLIVRSDLAERCMPFHTDLTTGQDLPFLVALATYGDWSAVDCGMVLQRKMVIAENEASSLSRQYEDRCVRWAKAYERAWKQLRNDLDTRQSILLCKCLKERWVKAAAFHDQHQQLVRAQLNRLKVAWFQRLIQKFEQS